MDELRFRVEEAADYLQIRFVLVTDSTLTTLRGFSDESRNFFNRAIHGPRLDAISDAAKNAWSNMLAVLRQMRDVGREIVDPKVLGEHLRFIFRDQIARNNLFYVCIGLGIGTATGYFIGAWVARPYFSPPVMKAIACLSIKEPDNVMPCLVKVPSLQATTDILIRVRAASIHRIDERIVNGYGRNLRRMIQRYNNYDHQELPLVIGRACAGVVEGVGRGSKSGLEIGDEVWLASPWYESGVASQIVVAPETRVARKPFIIGFEGAASLPYCGCVALTALSKGNLCELTCAGKRILVQNGCSPVGCVLTQLLKKWGAFVTATCNVRSVPVIKALGADDVIAFNCDDNIYELEERDLLNKELKIRKAYSFIFLTTATSYNKDFLKLFLTPDGSIIDTVDKYMPSDDYGFIMRLLCSIYVRLEKGIAAIFKSKPDWGGPHLCHLALDRLAGYVNDGILQTVVDQVYTPDDAEKAIAHICSPKSIGGTIVTFRS